MPPLATSETATSFLFSETFTLSYVEFALGVGVNYKPVSLNPSSTEKGGEYTNLPDIARFAVSIGYNALSLNTSSLHGNIFLNCFLSAVVEVPALLMAWLMLRRLPRRLCLSSTLALGGVLLLFIHLIPQHMSSVTITLVMLGKFGLSAAFSIVYPATAELYPTVVRSTALGTCSMASRVGSLSAPYFIYLGGFYRSLPYILIGSLNVLSGLLYFALPESFGSPLPETISEMQTLVWCKRRRSSCSSAGKCEEEYEQSVRL